MKRIGSTGSLGEKESKCSSKTIDRLRKSLPSLRTSFHESFSERDREIQDKNTTDTKMRSASNIIVTGNTTIRKRKQRNRKSLSVFTHTPEPRVSLLEQISSKLSETKLVRDTITILQTEDSLYGLVNLGVLILITSVIQLVVANYIKYGILIDVAMLVEFGLYDGLPALYMFAGMIAFSFTTYFLQTARVARTVNESTAFTLHLCSLLCMLTMPIKMAFNYKMSPLVAIGCGAYMFVLMMKMQSYYATNTILATEVETEDNLTSSDDDVHDTGKKNEYPNNVTFSSYCYFLFVPTLCYEIEYPRTHRIRWWYAAKEALQFVGCILIDCVIFVQFLLPVFRENNHFILYDLLRITIPSFTMWLIGFYGLFHCLLNSMSEVLRFADRQFYLDWWNAERLDEFWRKWNLIVHEWLLRHVYLESIHSGKASKKTAVILTFFVSALMHEIAFVMAFQVIRPWLFLGMFLQVPLMLLSQLIVSILPPESRRRWGNIFVWCSLFFGQPLIEILYIREWVLKHSDVVTSVHAT